MKSSQSPRRPCLGSSDELSLPIDDTSVASDGDAIGAVLHRRRRIAKANSAPPPPPIATITSLNRSLINQYSPSSNICSSPAVGL